MEVLTTDSFRGFDKLYSEHFSNQFPLPEAKHVVALRDVRSGDRIVASGFVKLFTEAIIVTDQTIPAISRIKAIDMLVGDLLAWAKEHRVEQVHSFTTSEFSKVLVNRYGFEHVHGVALVKNIG